MWLACAGVLWAAYAALDDGPAYDASLHAVFLGFVMSMVFAHAPVIVPAVLRVPLPYRRGFYVHLGLLHASLALRLIGGDLAGSLILWQWGGILGELAILLFLVVTAHGVLSARRKAGRRGPGDAAPLPSAIPETASGRPTVRAAEMGRGAGQADSAPPVGFTSGTGVRKPTLSRFQPLIATIASVSATICRGVKWRDSSS